MPRPPPRPPDVPYPLSTSLPQLLPGTFVYLFAGGIGQFPLWGRGIGFGVWFWFSVWVCIFIAHKRCLICSLPPPSPSLSYPFIIYYASAAVALLASLTVWHICVRFSCCSCCCWACVYSAASSQLTDCGSIFVFVVLAAYPYASCPISPFIDCPLSCSSEISAPQATLSRLSFRRRLQICNCYFRRIRNMFYGSTGQQFWLLITQEKGYVIYYIYFYDLRP